MAELTDTEYLSLLRAKRQELITGTQMVEVTYADRRVKYTMATLDQLNAEIERLERALGINKAGRRRPFGMVF